MKRRIYSIAVGIIGFLLAQKHTYWAPGTYGHDLKTSILGVMGGAAVGFLLGCIVGHAVDERQRFFKILYWLLAMAIFGYYLGTGKGVSFNMTVVVMGWSAGIGLVLGLLQYFLQSDKKTRRESPPQSASRT